MDFSYPLAPGPLFLLLVRWCVSALALVVTAYLVPGFRVRSFGSALIAAVVIGLANETIRPILMLLTFPLTLLTLGLFTFVVDAIVLKICAAVLRDFHIHSWLSAIVGAFILTLVQWLLHYAII